MQEHTTHDLAQEIPYGYCQCGCGSKTRLAPQTDPVKGWIKGQPLRYIRYHKGLEHLPKEAPNPSGMCMCGCGEPAPIAVENNAKLGHIKGQPVCFIVGHHVRLRPMRAAEDRYWEKVIKRGPDECWDWIGSKAPHGYGQLRINDRLVAAHRFSYELAIGPIPDGLDVLHKCDNPPCTNPKHLFVGTAKDNTADMLAKGRGSKPPRNDHRGENAPWALFTNAQVRELRRQHDELGVTTSELAHANGVDWDIMGNILKRISYQDA